MYTWKTSLTFSIYIEMGAEHEKKLNVWQYYLYVMYYVYTENQLKATFTCERL